MNARHRLAVDIGGTFTDAVLMTHGGEIRTAKVASTPGDPSQGFLQAVEKLLEREGLEPEAIDFLVHATTVATNAIIERRGARVGLITTRGFRDILEIARQIRPELYNLNCDKPPPLVPRYLSCEITERLDAKGRILQELDAGEVREAARYLRSQEVEAIVICFLHSYLNPQHEEQAAELVRQEYPEALVIPSSRVCPEFREYFRASTAVINGYIMPKLRSYLDTLIGELKARGFRAPLYLMQSSGGIAPANSLRDVPVYILESGPAAGAIAATKIGRLLGYQDVISLDMGGTTAKVCLIRNGQPTLAASYEVGSAASDTTSFTKAAGYPVRTPVIDLVEIGAGGGSIAWVDSGGALRVGPQSAGAEPGPACYGWGGQEPTIVDADLILGRIDPAYFLGGEMVLDSQAALRAIATRCAQPLGLDATAVAHGIIRVAEAHMMGAIRLVSVQRGYDPRGFALIAFGGAGPMHANRLAAELDIPVVIIPPRPGVASAWGLLVTDLKHEYRITHRQGIEELDMEALNLAFGRMEAKGWAELGREGVAPEARRLARYAEMRYVGQSYELRVPLPGGRLGEKEAVAMEEALHIAHLQAYGHAAPEEPVELVTLGLEAVGIIGEMGFQELPQGDGNSGRALKGEREVLFSPGEGFLPTSIYDRYALFPGDVIEGPAIIEEVDSTTLIHAGYHGVVERYGSIVITRRQATPNCRGPAERFHSGG